MNCKLTLPGWQSPIRYSYILGICTMILLGWSTTAFATFTETTPLEFSDCNGKALDLWLVKHDGSTEVRIPSSGKICNKDIPFTDAFIRVRTSGSLESMKIWLTGAVRSDNVENFAPYDSRKFWIVDGTYNVRVQLFERDNGSGTLCSERTFTFTVEDCSVPTLSLIHI